MQKLSQKRQFTRLLAPKASVSFVADLFLVVFFRGFRGFLDLKDSSFFSRLFSNAGKFEAFFDAFCKGNKFEVFFRGFFDYFFRGFFEGFSVAFFVAFFRSFPKPKKKSGLLLHVGIIMFRFQSVRLLSELVCGRFSSRDQTFPNPPFSRQI